MKIKCPNCKKEIDLVEHPQLKNRLVAYHDCAGLGLVSVYETDAPKATEFNKLAKTGDLKKAGDK